MAQDRVVLSLPIADIAIGERLGFYNEPHARQLGYSIAAEGQHDPIHVQRRGNAAKQSWMLVAGLHRLHGVAYAGLSSVDAIQVADATATPDELRRLELSENLDHRQRRPIERAIFIAERARQEEAVDFPDTVGEPSQVRAGRVRQSASITMMDAGWRKRAAVACGLSIAQFERYERLHREIVQALADRELIQRLNDHQLGDSMTAMMAVTRLCKRDDADADPYRKRRLLVQTIVDHPGIGSVDEAYQKLTGGSSKGDQALPHAHDERAFSHWSKMTPPQRHSFAVAVARDVPPSIAADMIASFKERGLL